MILPLYIIEEIIIILVNNSNFNVIKKLIKISSLRNIVIITYLRKKSSSKFRTELMKKNPIFDFTDFWKTGKFDKINVPYDFSQLQKVDTKDYNNIHIYMVLHTGDILTNIIIDGVGINKVIIKVSGIKFEYYFLNGGLINIELPTGGLFIGIIFENVKVYVFCEKVNFIYSKVKYIDITKDNRKLSNELIISNKFYTNYKSKIRENQICYGAFSAWLKYNE